jgi:hypothetical protein
MKETLDRLFEQFVQIAKENLLKSGSLAPFVFLLSGPREKPQIAEIVDLFYKTEADKDLLAKRIEMLIQRTGAWGYLIVNESWVLDGDDFPDGELPRDILPSQHPLRREAVWVALFTYEYHRGVAALFERQGKHIVFTKEIPMEPDMGFAGRFAEMLPPMS